MLWDISVWRVIVAVIVYFAIGSLWYSPLLFAKPWSAALGRKNSDMSNMGPAMVITFLSIVILCLVETYFVHVTGTRGTWRGLYLGLKLWLGFVGTTALINNSFQSGNKQLYAIDQGYHLLGIVAAGMILAA